MEQKKHIIIYTDGACFGNPGPGGWAAILCYKQHKKQLLGQLDWTTNNQMELVAAIQALSALKERCLVDLYTDSAYVKNGITKWLRQWEANNWKNSNKKLIKNLDLWQKLAKLNEYHLVNWHWVKGHNGNEMNEEVDKLAKQACANIT